MPDWSILKDLLITAAISSSICVLFIQKTKHIFPSSKWIPYYSFILDMIVAVLFCLSFTNISFLFSLWCGLFSYIGADTLYKALEGKLPSYSEIVLEEERDDEELEEIKYE